MPTTTEHVVRFDEIDAAGIVFFARFFEWSHRALERFFDDLPGGYVDLIQRQRIGFPAVHVESDWRSPLRYGDAVRIETSVAALGTTSVTFRFVFTRAAGDVPVATVRHVSVATDLATMKKVPLPEPCRAFLSLHLVPAAAGVQGLDDAAASKRRST